MAKRILKSLIDETGLSRQERELVCCYRKLDAVGREIHLDLLKRCAEPDKSEIQQGDTNQVPTNVYQLRPRSGNEAGPQMLAAPLPDDTVGALSWLLADAKLGKILGIAFAVMFRGRSYVVDVTDEARRSPTFTRGMLKKLDDELALL